eukprot:3742688-Karenia_brevis.AAC.1
MNNVRATLPRASRALMGWTKLRPPGQRLSMPAFLAHAVAGLLAAKGLFAMGVWIVLTFSAYLRPSETMRLMGQSLVPPVSQLSKHWGLI